MLLKPDCFSCLYEQALRVAKALECEERCAKSMMQEAAKVLAAIDPNQTPPEAAVPLYAKLAEVAGVEDVYAKQKQKTIQQALPFVHLAKEKIAKSSKPLATALKAAVAGNVIDFAMQVSFKLEEEFEKIFTTPFAIDHQEAFFDKLQKAQSLVILGDNVAEHLFDKLLMQEIKRVFDLDIYYFVRGKPIINDVTIKEAKEANLDEVCKLIDSGVDTPGFVFSRASKEAKRIFLRADVVLAKGMGNYEVMESKKDERVYFLFKVKCQVVASHIGKNVGDLICANLAKEVE